MKRALALTMIAASMAAWAEGEMVGPTVYGKINLVVEQEDLGVAGKDSSTGVSSYASRFGLKGEAPLTDNLAAVYMLEFGVAIDGDGDNISPRDQYVGLTGNWGTAMIGRRSTLFKESNNAIGQFEDIQGDTQYLFPGDNRLTDSLHYKSPAFGQFSFGASVIADGNSSQNDETGYGLAGFFGDAGLKKVDYFLTAGYEDQVVGYTNAVVGGGVKLIGIELRAMVQQSENDSSGKDATGWMANVAYNLDKWRLKAQYGDVDTYELGWSKRKSGDTKLYYQNQLALGVDYSFTKTTQATLWYVLAERAPEAYIAAEQVDDTSYAAIGLVHVF